MFGRTNRGRSTGSGRIFLTVQRGERVHCLGLPRPLFWIGAGLVPGSFAIAVLAGMAVIYRDDLVSGLISHERAIVEGYEQKIAQDRAENQARLDAMTDRARRERAALDERLHDLATRQATLEARTARVAALASRLGGNDVTGSITTVGRGDAMADAAGPAPGALSRLLRFGRPQATPSSPPLPTDASAYAPAPGTRPSAPSKPRPSSLDITPADDAALSKRSERRSAIAPEDLGQSLDWLESTQAATVAALDASARRRVSNYESVFTRLGLDANRLHVPDTAMGGPMVPIPNDDLGALETEMARAERLARLAMHVPLAAPADVTLEMTSPFGPRTDPFTGRPMMHTGVDLREEPGAPIYATAPGRVTVADAAGGYGNMVEIDHGNGLRTRYGHLSKIEVAEDATVKAGDVIGRAGSTGRSTGTHLHYEVRVEGEAVDPTRFLEAGAKLAEAKL